MFDQINANLTVMHLLEEACIDLMKQSFVLKSQDGSQLGHRSVYYRMLWSKCSCANQHEDCVCPLVHLLVSVKHFHFYICWEGIEVVYLGGLYCSGIIINDSFYFIVMYVVVIHCVRVCVCTHS